MATQDADTGADGPTQPPSPYAGLPKWQPRPEPIEPEAPHVWHECHRCREPHPFTRRYWLPTVIFALIVTVWRWENYVYCPGCMRVHLAIYFIPNALVATIACPAVFMGWGWAFCRTFSRRRLVPDPEY